MDLRGRFKAQTENLIPKESKQVIVACSGGLDSMVLVDLLTRTRPDLETIVVHLDHGQREDADLDLALVTEMCESRDLKLHSEKLESDGEGASEEALRSARYEKLFFYAKQHDCPILTAHHADDQVETYLFRLLRGAHPETLRGISEKSVREKVLVLRPLLPFFKTELKEYAEENDVEWREDSTNEDPRFARNRIRHELVPLLEDLRSGSTKRVLSFFETLKTSVLQNPQMLELEEVDQLKSKLRSENGIEVLKLDFNTVKPAIDGLLGSDSHRTTQAQWSSLRKQLEQRNQTKTGGGPKKIIQFPGGAEIEFRGNHLFWKQ